MNTDDDDPWLDEDATAPAVLERNAAQEWERLSNKFTDVCLSTNMRKIGHAPLT